MPYTKVFNKTYPGGYKDRPDLSTPETAASLNAKDNAFEHIEEYLLNQKTSDLQNDSEFVTEDDLTEALKVKADKSKTYTKTEVDELVPDNKELLEDLSDSEGKLAYKGEVIGGGGNANERELTYAEYQALSEEEKMNGTNYFVTDYPSGSGGGASHVDFENYAELGTLKFGVDGDGNYGYYKADDSFVPFKSGGNIGFETIGNLDETSSVSFEVPKDKLYLCVLNYGYTPDYHFVATIPSVGNYGGRFVVSNDYKTIMYNFGGYTLSNLNIARDELENTIKFTLTKSAKYTFGNVELMYFPIGG